MSIKLLLNKRCVSIINPSHLNAFYKPPDYIHDKDAQKNTIGSEMIILNMSHAKRYVLCMNNKFRQCNNDDCLQNFIRK